MEVVYVVGTVAIALALAIAFVVLVTQIVRLRRPNLILDHRAIVITGAGSGIGRELAQKIALETRGTTLILFDLNLKALKAAEEDINAQCKERKHAAPRLLSRCCDVSDQSAVKGNIEEVLHTIAPLEVSVLVNNAGIVSGDLISQLAPEAIRKTFAVNTLSHFWMVKALLPSLRSCANKGAMIVTLASSMGMASATRLGDYCSSKAAVIAFHECLRLELLKESLPFIDTLLVCPIGVKTGMFQGIFDTSSWRNRLARFCIPMLETTDVVDQIFMAMRRRDRVLIGCASGWRGVLLPWVPALARLLPVEVYDQLLMIAGGWDGMDTFVGRTEGDNKDKVQ